MSIRIRSGRLLVASSIGELHVDTPLTAAQAEQIATGLAARGLSYNQVTALTLHDDGSISDIDGHQLNADGSLVIDDNGNLVPLR